MTSGATQSAGRPSGRQPPDELAREIEVPPLGDDERDAARDPHHAERGDERRQPDEDDEDGAERPGDEPDQQRDQPSRGRAASPRPRTGLPQTTLASAMTAPGERSMPPEMMTIAAPTAAMP